MLSNLIGAGASIIGQAMANNATRDIAYQNNQTAIQLMREQTFLEQEYNSVGRQMQRAIAAGVNPYTLAGVQPTSVSSAAVPSLDSPVMQNPFGEVDNYAGNITNELINSKKLAVQERSLDIQLESQKVELMRSIIGLMGSDNLTSSDLNTIMKTVFKDDEYSPIAQFSRDDAVVNSFVNKIAQSDLDTEAKRMANNWYDTIKQAEFDLMSEQTNLTKEKSVTEQSMQKLNAVLAKMNDARRRELEQCIINLAEQQKILSAQGTIDSERAKFAFSLAKSEAEKLASEADVSYQEATFWMWSQMKENPSSLSIKVGPVTVSSKGRPADDAILGVVDFKNPYQPWNIKKVKQRLND